VDETLLIAGVRDPVIADYAAFASRARDRRISVLSRPDVCRRTGGSAERCPLEGFATKDYLAAHAEDRLAGIVLFLDRNDNPRDRELLQTLAEIAAIKQPACVCIVSSFRVHLGDAKTAQAEELVRACFRKSPSKVVVFRPGHVLSPSSRVTGRLKACRFLAPLVPDRFTTCCVDGEELFAAVEQELAKPAPGKRRTYALLGHNRSLKSLMQRATPSPAGAFTRLAAALLRLALIAPMCGLLFDLLAKAFPCLRAWDVNTLRPQNIEELLALYNPYNFRHVKLVGYNNGVVHFGHRYPDKTIVSTVGCNRVARVRRDVATFDAGVTIHQAMDVLRRTGKELHVIPNYSYVSLGTSFFIPIHGSASKYCTVAETIDRVLLYDPVPDRFLALTRQDPQFGQYMYNLSADVLLLRLSLRVKEKSRYFMKQLDLVNPSAQEVLNFFHDAKASNVEVRKSGASSHEVKVYQYFTEGATDGAGALELPRDRLGSLWDRLEENPITSALFHGLTRRLAHHVELFLPEDDFARFWETHRTQPLSKIQLRYIKQDGLANSPFRQHDCVSADLFMLKKHRTAFEAYVKNTFRAARFNPGKHSM
jgi:hypothetical protein